MRFNRWDLYYPDFDTRPEMTLLEKYRWFLGFGDESPEAWHRYLEKSAGDPTYQALRIEATWFLFGRPFYEIYPKVAESLASIDVSLIDTKSIPRLEQPICVCFAEGREPAFFGGRVTSIVVRSGDYGLSGCNCVMCMADFSYAVQVKTRSGEVKTASGVVHGNLGNIGDAESSCKFEDGMEVREWSRLMATVFGTSMLASDKRFCEPVLLSRDRSRNLSPKQLDAAVRRAKARGVNGISVGRDLEHSPHIRRPHFGIRWTGKGRSEPRVVPISGCVVGKEKLYPIPTGYEGSGE